MQRFTTVSRSAIVAMVSGAVLVTGVPASSAAPAPGVASVSFAGVALAKTAPEARRLKKAKRSTRSLGRTTMREYQEVRDDPRLPELRSDIAREISDLAREGQRRVNSRLITLEDVNRVKRVKKIRARIAKEDPAAVEAMIDEEIAKKEAADAEYGLLSRPLRNNEDGVLGPVVTVLKDLGL